MKTFVALLCASLTACSLAPRTAPQLAVHDLGNRFELLPAELPLSQLSVSGSPPGAALVMQYRLSERPSERLNYAFNRWAATPARLVEIGLGQSLSLSPAGACRLDFQLSDFILEIHAQDRAEAYLAGSLRLLGEGRKLLAVRRVDLRTPLAVVDPAGFALAQAQGVRTLAGEAASWVSGDLAQACRKR